MNGPADNVVALVPWTMSLRRAEKRRRAFDLLEADDVKARVASASALETYYAIKEIGLEDAVGVLAYVDREQTRALIDIESWHGHRFEPADLLLWLSAFREAGIDAAARAARALDPEVLALLLRRRLYVTNRPKEDDSDPDTPPDWLVDPPEEILPLIETPDRRYIIAARTHDEMEETPIDEEDRKWLLALVDDLYKDDDPDTIAFALRLAATDLSSALEEDAYRFRNARLEDLGFPSLERALEIYGTLDPERLEAEAEDFAPDPDVSVPVHYTKPLAEGLFSAAMSRLDAKTITWIESNLVPVANRALVADGVEPGQLEEVTATLTRMKGYVEIALAHGVDEERWTEVAADRLARVPIAELFRIGYTVTTRLKTRARALLSEYPAALFDDDDRPLLEALTMRRPRLSHLGVERAFGGPEDVTWVDGRLARLERLIEAAEELDILNDPAGTVLPPAAERTIDVLMATASARAVLEDRFSARPFTAEELADLADRLAVAGGPAFAPADVEQAVTALSSRSPQMAGMLADEVASALLRVADVLWPLAGASHIDPRFVGVVLTRV